MCTTSMRVTRSIARGMVAKGKISHEAKATSKTSKKSTKSVSRRKNAANSKTTTRKRPARKNVSSPCLVDDDLSVNAVASPPMPTLESTRHDLMMGWVSDCSTSNAQALLKALLQRPDIGPLGFIDVLGNSSQEDEYANKPLPDDGVSEITESDCMRHFPSCHVNEDEADWNDRGLTVGVCLANKGLDPQKVYEQVYKRSHHEGWTLKTGLQKNVKPEQLLKD